MGERSMTSHSRSLALFLVAILIFGTNGVMVHMAGLPSSVIASVRGIIGALTLAAWARMRGDALSLAGIPRSQLLRIAVSGACIGFNWVLIFEAFRISAASDQVSDAEGESAADEHIVGDYGYRAYLALNRVPDGERVAVAIIVCSDDGCNTLYEGQLPTKG